MLAIKALTLLVSLSQILANQCNNHQISTPQSMFDEGLNSHRLYLKRDEHTNPEIAFTSKDAKSGHFFYHMTLGDTQFPLQVTSYGAITGIIGNNCRLSCEVDKKYSLRDGQSYIGGMVMHSFKRFD